MDAREKAWSSLWKALPARWTLGPVVYDPGRFAFSVTARGPHPGRGKVPVAVSGTGEDETAALRDLDDRLRGREDFGGYLDALRQRVRLAYVQGAERARTSAGQ